VLIRKILPVLAAAVLALSCVHEASAQGKLEAHYTARLAGVPIGKGTWVINIGDTSYTAVASGVTAGLLKFLTNGQGTTSSRGVLANGKPVVATYAASIKTKKKDDEVLMTVAEGKVKELKLNPPVEPDGARIEVTEAHKTGVIDPMTGSLLRVGGEGTTVTAEACQRSLSVFDGRLRYDLKMTFKRMETVKAGRGYAGPAVVCGVTFTPLAGFNPERYAVKYVASQKDMEVWMAPIAGTRVLVPFRFETPTPVGNAVLEATEFVTAATTASNVPAPKTVKTQ